MFHWDGSVSWMTLTDDGDGMRPDELNNAMRPGSSNPLDDRNADDLGRFGLGLKTASFSQARMLTGSTPYLDHPAIESRVWDLDYVQRTDRWVVLTDSPYIEELAPLLSDASGTVVAWHQLDRIVDDRPSSDSRARNSFYATIDDIRMHLEMVFHRYIDDGLQITVNGTLCQAWDPFMEKNPFTERLQRETLTLTTALGTERRIDIQPFILPHNSKLDPDAHRRGGGPKGWNLQQGFYLYRRRRLIVAGDWFDRGTKPEEHHKLARVRVEFDQDLDATWAIRSTCAKQRRVRRRACGRTSSALHEPHAAAAKRFIHRGADGSRPRSTARPSDSDVDSGHLRSNRALRRQPPAPKRLLSGFSDNDATEETIRLIETTLPVAHILSQGFRDENLIYEGRDNDELTRAGAARPFCALLNDGESAENARRIVIDAQPFDSADDFIRTLRPEDCQ